MADDFTLAQLAEKLALPPRTIRSYIEQGLLRGPEIGGRGARYTNYHLDRINAIRALKELYRLPLSEVRRRLMVISGPELAALAKEGEAASARSPLPDRHSALGYIRSLRATSPPVPAMEANQQPFAPIDILLDRLKQLAGETKPARRARGHVWTTVAITGDVELRIRGIQTDFQQAQWEHIADHLREILIGGMEGIKE